MKINFLTVHEMVTCAKVGYEDVPLKSCENCEYYELTLKDSEGHKHVVCTYVEKRHRGE